MPLVITETPPPLPGNFPKDHGLSHIVQDRQGLHRKILKHPESQPVKAEHIHIGKAAARVQADQLFLGLHGVLLRHQKQVLLLRVRHRLPDDGII